MLQVVLCRQIDPPNGRLEVDPTVQTNQSYVVLVRACVFRIHHVPVYGEQIFLRFSERAAKPHSEHQPHVPEKKKPPRALHTKNLGTNKTF